MCKGADMFGKRIDLFRIFGFGVRIDLSWVVVAILIAWSLSAESLRSVHIPVGNAFGSELGLFHHQQAGAPDRGRKEQQTRAPHSISERVCEFRLSDASVD